jgi:polyisoprenyl-phosphate glycosyltransferase
MKKLTSLSVIFSVFNEEESLPELMNRIISVIQPASYTCELIFVDDGSSDGSAGIIRNFREKEQPGCTCRLIRFSRNFGHEAAMIAGIDHATGDAIICMDADLQHPAEMIPQMIERFEEGNEIVRMVREANRGNSATGNLLSSLFYSVINHLSTHKLEKSSSDFFLISRKVATLLRNDFRERNRFLRGIIQIIGFKSASIPYSAPGRVSGRTKYSVTKLSRLTVQAIASFSNAPLYLGIWFGFIFSLFSIIVGIYSMCVYFFGKTPPSGYTTIVLFLSISFSILFFLVGIIGIYTGYLFDEQKKRPIYIVEETFPDEKTENR